MATSTSKVRNSVLHLSPHHHHHPHQQLQHRHGHHHLLYRHAQHHHQQQHHRHGIRHLCQCHGHHYHQQHHRGQQQEQHFHGHLHLVHCYQHQMHTMRKKEEEELLWEDLFSKPSQWLDYRRRKRAPSHPDFRHKTSRAPLWLNSLYKPHWVDPRLAVPGPGTPHEENLVRDFCRKGELNLAMDALSHMDHDGFIPSDTLYVSLLKACYKSKSLFHAIHVHAHVVKHRTQLTGPLQNALVITLAKCGSLED
eukprot:c5353_g1_i1 orf=1-750(-)